jgi:hypothetical protein
VTTPQTAFAAGDRIDALLRDPPAFAIEGYVFVACYRDEPGPICYDTPNGTDPTLRWFNRGGHYRLIAAWP